MYRKGIFVATSFAVVTGLVTFFQEPPVSKAADIDANKLYMTHCKTCHGTDGKPTDLGSVWRRGFYRCSLAGRGD